MAVGGTDKRFFGGKMTWHKVEKNPYGNWMLRLNSLKVGNTEVCGGTYGCTVIIDTGTSLLVASKAVHDVMQKTVKIKPSCKDFAKNPKMDFKFGKSTYSLRPSDYTIEMAWGAKKRCSSALVAMQGTLLKKLKAIVPKHNDKVIIMGDVFLRRVYTAFDNSNPDAPKVGFAASRSAATVQAHSCVVLIDTLSHSYGHVIMLCIHASHVPAGGWKRHLHGSHVRS